MLPGNRFLSCQPYIIIVRSAYSCLSLTDTPVVGGIPTKYTGEVITIDAQGRDQVVPGLYAAGEAACVSVHGANRLGANSLLDIVVFGRACAHHVKETLTPGKPHKKIPDDAGIQTIEYLDQIRFGNHQLTHSVVLMLTSFSSCRNADGPIPTAKIRLDMQKAMQSDAAVFRSVIDSGCRSASTEVSSLAHSPV